ncbi:hypothetical protein AVEN_35218-1 [Araneus ventricosus]|uniref:RNase H type-1 domain-containing protein n=1 Tax=Araneus ventricosus TaxID=182803 RepID=A0A4Y2PM88_ARAVE|nr:hypothetical protein AVEN_35218-1 [Araneus ventricosus]
MEPSDFEAMTKGHLIHPADFQLDNQIFLEPETDYPTINSTWTDGSKSDEGTGSALCCYNDKDEITKEWLGKLNQENSVFQAELPAIYKSITHHANSTCLTKIWIDSLSSLQAIQNPVSPLPLVREIHKLLQDKKHIHLGWIKAQTGHQGNETADVLATRAIT